MSATAPLKRHRLFPMGQVVMTQGINELVGKGLNIFVLLAMHNCGYWEEMDEEDQETNRWAVDHGARILSSYDTEDYGKIWVITEADRSSTCVLLPEEY